MRSDRSAALTVHRTVIHYRRLRFAYLKEKPLEQLAKPGFVLKPHIFLPVAA